MLIRKSELKNNNNNEVFWNLISATHHKKLRQGQQNAGKIHLKRNSCRNILQRLRLTSNRPLTCFKHLCSAHLV